MLNPVLDLSTYDLPVNAYDIFGNRNETAFEIGYGEGEFIVELANKNKDWNFLGIEIKYYRFKKAVQLARKEGAANLKLLHFDVNIAVNQVFEDNIFDKVYINFPDPWPKDRHKKHRIINESFLYSIRSLMKKNSTIEFASDHLDYVNHTIEQFKSNPNFKNTLNTKSFTTKVKNRPLTKFEKQFIEENKQIYYLTFKKVI